jgi:hypothetical protein
MPIDFPSSPVNGQRYSYDLRTWEYNDGKWLLFSGSPSFGIYDDANIDGGSHDTLVEAQVVDLDSAEILDGGTA